MNAPRIDVTSTWAHLNDNLVRLVDYIPDNKMNWSPRSELWNFRGILIHIAAARDDGMGRRVNDGVDAANVFQTVRSKADVQTAYVRTWERLAAFLGDQASLDATYEIDNGGPVTGHSIAFDLLEHDIHHRAAIFDYLTILGIETPGLALT